MAGRYSPSKRSPSEVSRTGLPESGPSIHACTTGSRGKRFGRSDFGVFHHCSIIESSGEPYLRSRGGMSSQSAWIGRSAKGMEFHESAKARVSSGWGGPSRLRKGRHKNMILSALTSIRSSARSATGPSSYLRLSASSESGSFPNVCPPPDTAPPHRTSVPSCALHAASFAATVESSGVRSLNSTNSRAASSRAPSGQRPARTHSARSWIGK